MVRANGGVSPFVMGLCSTMAFNFRRVTKLIRSRWISHCHRWTICIIFSMSDFWPKFVISLRLWSVSACIFNAFYTAFILSSYGWQKFHARLGRLRICYWSLIYWLIRVSEPLLVLDGWLGLHLQDRSAYGVVDPSRRDRWRGERVTIRAVWRRRLYHLR